MSDILILAIDFEDFKHLRDLLNTLMTKRADNCEDCKSITDAFNDAYHKYKLARGLGN